MRDFQIGDLVEGRQDGRWVKGFVRGTRTFLKNTLLCVDVIESDQPPNASWHTACGLVKSGKGWEVSDENAKLDKNYIVQQIIKDLM